MTKVAIQGIRGSYSSVAAIEAFSDRLELVECTSFDGVFQAMASGLATHAVLPIRNSIVGKIDATNRLIAEYRPRSLGTLKVTVDHVLAAIPGTLFNELDSVRSHSEALKQCSKFLEEHPHLRAISGFDTASSIRSVIYDNIVGQAAICSKAAAEMYGAEVLRENIADTSGNMTTFAILKFVPKRRTAATL
ncbi:MAG TPA: prephenate dehydratase domain-containing protein [Pyrinomonadaceae bacterium]|nr:prephenate dehydratase domain-containing protein [Pyrinomonadaceae bacterium]